MTRTLVALALVASTIHAAEPRIQRDIAYTEPRNERQLLDVYSPAEGKNHPIIFWIHGGGWRQGNKSNVQRKPQAFTDQGYVFVSTNYRLAPAASVKEMTADIAKGIHWVHDHAHEFGGDPNSIFVMGHSAGAHLAALVCTDDRYLRAEGLSLAFIKGCAPVDTAMYDVQKRIAESGIGMPAAMKEIFGDNETMHKELSPVTHVAKGKNIPPFLILHVAARPDSKSQSLWLAEKLKAAEVSVQVVAGEGKTHGTINSELGLSADEPTKQVYAFLDDTRQKYPSPQVHAYAESGDPLQTLDVYSPAGANGKNLPIVFWIHGGGWQRGDKNDVQVKPRAFMDRGFVFVSTNYRLFPSVTIKQMAGDVAKAIRWTHDNAAKIGGDPKRFFVMGHSAGAQLAALVSTDDSYLKSEGLSLSIIKGCVPVDGDTYDVPLQIATVEQRRADIYRQKFGDESAQKDLSPITHVASNKSIPPVLILHVADHPETKLQSQKLAEALQKVGVSAQAYPAAGKIHTTIHADLGLTNDEPTKVLYDFLDRSLR